MGKPAVYPVPETSVASADVQQLFFQKAGEAHAFTFKTTTVWSSKTGAPAEKSEVA